MWQIVEFKVRAWNVDRIPKNKRWRVNYAVIKLLMNLSH